MVNIFVGNEVHIVIHADTEYDKKESNNHFGMKCQVVGYEWTMKMEDVGFERLGYRISLISFRGHY